MPRGRMERGRVAARPPMSGFGRFAIACAALCVAAACVSAKYKSAPAGMPPARELNVPFPPTELQTSLAAVVTDGAPGSWKQEAFWDEYIVEFHNRGDAPLRVASVTVVGADGALHSPGDNPWALERESKSLERRYRDSGVAFARMAAPRVLVSSAEPVVMASAGLGAAGTALAATASAVALPVYAVTAWGLNRHHKAAIEAEFHRRRLVLPLDVAPGETRRGSLFFSMMPNPRSLDVHWSRDARTRDSSLSLGFLNGLHVAPGTTATREIAAQPR